MFLTFPAITGLIAWLWLPQYSLAYGILTSVWCTVFLEYWKIQEIDLSLRWNVKGIHHVKVNRPQFKYEKEYVDQTGRKHYYFPRWKKVVRQLLQLPFLLIAFLALGLTIVAVFTIEILISETYAGPYKDYLVCPMYDASPPSQPLTSVGISPNDPSCHISTLHNFSP